MKTCLGEEEEGEVEGEEEEEGEGGKEEQRVLEVVWKREYVDSS